MKKTFFFPVNRSILFFFTFLVFIAIHWVHAKTSFNAKNPSNYYLQLEIKGGINPASADYVKKGIQDAKSKDANFVLLIIDTPGGLLNSTKDIVQAILNAPLPVITFVHPAGASATSAGVFITIAGHIAAMSPGSSIGAAHPVTGSGKDIKKEGGSDMAKKVENYTIAFIEGIANKTKRNAQWTIRAVKHSESITADKAVKMNVVDFLAASVPDLLQKINNKKVLINNNEVILRTDGIQSIIQKMNIMQKFLDILSTPNIALLLLSLGSLGIIAEIYSPGTYFPGVIGGIAFILGLISLQILPINYGGLALLGLAILLLVAEIMVPSFGILGIGGIISFVAGALFLFNTPESDLTVSWSIVLSLTGGLGLFMALAGFMIGRVAFKAPHSGPESLIGEKGRVVQEILPGKIGKVFFHGEYWNAISAHPLDKGDRVKVTALQGLQIEVEPIYK